MSSSARRRLQATTVASIAAVATLAGGATASAQDICIGCNEDPSEPGERGITQAVEANDNLYTVDDGDAFIKIAAPEMFPRRWEIGPDDTALENNDRLSSGDAFFKVEITP